ncbi:MAG: DUF4365 domain-containing protein [Petrotogales bacterium]
MPTTREIDQMAQNVFKGSLPPGWLIREQRPDIYVDYFVEIADNSEPSGIIFGVQLKGTGSPRYAKRVIKISIKTKHVKYYLDKLKQPIFLVVVDVKKKKGYWLFVQEWVSKELKPRNWKEQNKIDIKIPVTNSLSDVQKLRRGVSRAESYMRELWPSSIPAAVQHEKESLEELDHRIQVDISYRRERIEYSLRAKETFNFNIQFAGASNIQNKFSDLLDRGKSIVFDTHEIVSVKGSPLLEKAFNKSEQGKFVLEPTRKVQASLLLSTIDSQAQEKTIIYGVEGMIWVGEKIARFEGSLKKTPFKTEFAFPLRPLSENNPLTVSFRFDTSEWQDIPVLDLPYFEKLKEFFTSIQEGCSLKIVCEINGNHIFTATSPAKIDHSFIELTVRHLELFDMVRLIAKKANINPLYPKDGSINKDEMETILLLIKLIRNGEHRQSGNGATFKGKLLPSDNFYKMLEKSSEKAFSAPLAIETMDEKFKLLGKEFNFGLLRYTLTNSRIITDLSGITRANQEIYKDGIEVEWSGGAESELIISKV